MNEEPETVVIKGSTRKFIEKLLPGIDLRKRISLAKAKELCAQAVVASRFKSIDNSGIRPGSMVYRKLEGDEKYVVDHLDQEGYVHLQSIDEKVQPQELEVVERIW